MTTEFLRRKGLINIVKVFENKNSQIFTGFNPTTSFDVAYKVTRSNPMYKKYLLSEIDVMCTIKHKNFLDVWEPKYDSELEQISYFMTYGNSLANEIKRSKPFHFLDVAKIIGDLFHAVTHLRTQFGLTHSNIHPNNIILYEGDYKLMDIKRPESLVVTKKGETTFDQNPQNLLYRAPELVSWIDQALNKDMPIQVRPNSFSKADVYSIAMVALELLGADKQLLKGLGYNYADESYNVILQQITNDILEKNPSTEPFFVHNLLMLLNQTEQIRADSSQCVVIYNSYHDLILIRDMDLRAKQLLDLKKYDQALEWFEKALIIKQGLDYDEKLLLKSIVDSYKNITYCHMKLLDYLSVFEKSLKLIDFVIKKDGRASPYLPEIYQTLGDRFAFFERYIEALRYHKKALIALTAQMMPKDLDLGKLCLNIAKGYYIVGLYHRAVEYNTKALNFLKASPNTESLVIQANLGLLNAMNSETKTVGPEARQLIAKMIITLRDDKGIDSYEMGDLFVELAKFYKSKKDYKQSRTYLDKAENIYKRQPSGDGSRTFNLNIEKLSLMTASREFKKAWLLLNEIRKESNSNNKVDKDHECSVILTEEGMLHFNQKNFDEAIRCFEEARRIRTGIKKSPYYENAKLLLYIAEAQKAKELPNLAKKPLKKSLAMLKKSVNNLNHDYLRGKALEKSLRK